MNQDKLEEITVITSQDGIWREEKVPLTGLGLLSLAAKFVGEKDPDIERSWSPFQWGRMYKEKMSPGFEVSMKDLRTIDDNIRNFSNELNYLTDILPRDPTKLPDIALILIEIKQRLDSIVEAGKQLKPAKDKKLTDFYGRFHIKIPPRFRTASEIGDGKIANAGLIGDFIKWVGKAIYELTDSETREMKRVVNHLLETTRSTVKDINRTLDDMLSARKTGDIDKYIEDVKFIAQEQADFKREFSSVYDAYLKVPYEHALEMEEAAKREAEEQGKVFKPSNEEVSVGPAGVEIREVESPPTPAEADPIGQAQRAEEGPLPEEGKPIYGPPPPVVEGLPTPPMEPVPDTGITRISPVELAQERDQGFPPSIQVEEPRRVRQPTPIGVEEAKPESEIKVELPPGGMEVERFSPGISAEPPISEPPISVGPPISEPPVSEPPKAYRRIAPPVSSVPPVDVRLGPVGGESTPSSGSPLPLEAPPEKKPRKKRKPAERKQKNTSIEIQDAMVKVSHARFLTRLGKIAETENKYIVAAFMAKYSEELEETNPQASAALLRAAQELSND